MFRTTFRKRFAAVFCLITFLQSLVFPPLAQALTAGPTTPETSSFEPVDTTDMVNLQTGDFTYNIPLLEVPGPEGGYPVSLSYHGGIRPLEDASWAGLGWTLSPGAINRVVNNYPDDHKGITQTVTDHWQGGTTQTFSVGVGLGIPKTPFSIGLNLSVSNDTYKGFNGDIGFNIKTQHLSANANGNGFSLGYNRQFGKKGKGPSLGLNVGFRQGLGFSAGAAVKLGSQGFNVGFADRSPYLGVSALNAMSIGFNSRGMSYGLGTQAKGPSPQANNNYRISTSSQRFSIKIPLKLQIHLGYNYQRYWINESDEVKTYGTLYAKESKPANLNITNRAILPDDIAFDCYALPEAITNIVDEPDPEQLMGGSFPAYDNYQVMAQGLSGHIQPYLFENGSLFRKKIVNNETNQTLLSFRLPREFTKSPFFRTPGDFSSSLTLTADPDLDIDYWAPTASDQAYSAPSSGFSSANFRMAGSRHIETFTNREILFNPYNAQDRGFINYPNISNERDKTSRLDQIGGYSITNSEGVTYHYALPVYNNWEFTRSEQETSSSGVFFNDQSNRAYAYTWLLTAITGPDFVDRGGTNGSGDGFADEEDYGYWVTFSYGKWLDNYKWRTPFEGANADLHPQTVSYSTGNKQIYYLDAIKTRSHTALFFKDLRKDGKSANGTGINGGIDIENEDFFCEGNAISHPSNIPHSLLRLDKIYLVKNAAFDGTFLNMTTIRALGNLQEADEVEFSTGACPVTVQYHSSDNVLDISDISGENNHFVGAFIENHSIKSIELDNDHYDLCPETANSYDNDVLYTNQPMLSDKHGKLTLRSISYLGQNGIQTLPSQNFVYDDPGLFSTSFDILTASTLNGVPTGNGDVQITGNPNDILNQVFRYTDNGEHYYLFPHTNLGNEEYAYHVLGENMPATAHSGNMIVTNNPPYHADRYDYFGFYKPDLIFSNLITGPTSSRRTPTLRTNNSRDAWSLRSITTPIGADINVKYKPRLYHSLVKQNKTRLNIKSIQRKPPQTGTGDEFEIKFYERVDLNDFFSVGDQIEITFPHGINVYTETVTVNSVNGYNGIHHVIRTTYPFANNSGIISSDKGFVGFDCIGCAGDGVQVAEIEVTDGQRSRVTKYEYGNGTSSYLPSYGFNPYPVKDFLVDERYVHKFHEGVMEIFALAREIPSPGVMYETVEITEEENGLVVPGKKRYRFRTFTDDMVQIEYGSVVNGPTTPPPGSGILEEIEKRTVTIKDKTTQIGNLLSYELIDGNGQIVSSTVNDYVDDEINEDESEYADYDNQGVIHQGFNEMRTQTTYEDVPRYYIKGVESIRQEYPSVLKSTTLTADSRSVTTYNRKFDLLSGAVTEVESEDGYGKHYLTKTEMAHTKYAGMGSPFNNISRKNMLTQEAGSTTYRSDGNGNTIGNPIAALAMTWHNGWRYRAYDPSTEQYYDEQFTDPNYVWRKHKSYSYQGPTNPDGSFQTWSPFSWLSSPSAEWLKHKEVTRYDHYSKPLEEVDIEGQYAAVKLGYDQTLPLVTATPSKYVEVAFSGAEDKIADRPYFGGEVKSPAEESQISETYAHTGKYSIALDAGNRYGFTYRAEVNLPGQTPLSNRLDYQRYEVRVWVHESNVNLGSGYLYCHYFDANDETVLWESTSINNPSTIKAGEWYQLRLPINISSATTPNCTRISMGCWVSDTSPAIHFDDFRFAPVDAAVSSFVYDSKTDQLTYQLDQEHFYTKYEYDPAGRLLRVYRETTENPTGQQLVSENEYHYLRPF